MKYLRPPAATLGDDRASACSVTNLGTIGRVPSRSGGMAFPDSNTLLLGSRAAYPNGEIYPAPVTLGVDGHINGFGTGSFVARARRIDSGLVVAPNGSVQFNPYGARPDMIGLLAADAAAPAKFVESPLSQAPSARTGASVLQMMPAGFAGVGTLLMADDQVGTFTTAALVAEGQGGFNFGAPSPGLSIPDDAEGVVTVAAGHPGFANHSMVLAGDCRNADDAFDLDDHGTPVPNTHKTSVSGATGGLFFLQHLLDQQRNPSGSQVHDADRRCS